MRRRVAMVSCPGFGPRPHVAFEICHGDMAKVGRPASPDAKHATLRGDHAGLNMQAHRAAKSGGSPT